MFFDGEVRRASGRDLGEVGDAQDLKALAKPSELLPHHRCDPSTNARIDFVEDESLVRLLRGGERLQREHHTRELTTRDDAGERA